MTARVLAAVALICITGPGAAVAQDSSRADWRTWFATNDSVARCRALPLVSRVYGGQGEYTIHRTPTGGTCQAGPGPSSPLAWVIDSIVFCPDSNPARWASAPTIDQKRILEVVPSRDSSLLASFKCTIRPRAAVLVRTGAQ